MARPSGQARLVQRLIQQGSASHQQGRLAEAERCYDEALRRQPGNPEALYLAGLAALEANRPTRALELLRRAVAANPSAAAYSALASACQVLGRPDDAVVYFGKAVDLDPGHAADHYGRGKALQDTARPADAIASYDRAIDLMPDFAEAHCNRGTVLQAIGHHQAAIASFDRALALRPDDAGAYYNRGNAHREIDRAEQAIADYDQAIALRPSNAEAHSNRGIALHRINRHAEAVASFDQAIAINRDFAQAYCNRGTALYEMKRHQDALADYATAIALQPDFADARWNQGLVLLTLGDFAAGWQLHEWRRKLKALSTDRVYPQPTWPQPTWPQPTWPQPTWPHPAGQVEDDIRGQVLFIHHEFGLGDTIQFCRYVKLLGPTGARIVLSVQDALLNLIRRMDPDIEVVGQAETPARFDRHCPLMTLPLACATTLQTIPSAPRYIAADEDLRRRWESRLPPTARPRIAVAWRGNPEHRNDHNRSLPLAGFLPLLCDGADWICLHHDLRPAEAQLLRQDTRITCFDDALNSLDQAAGLLECVDLVITVDTSFAHLAAAMGKPVWILLCHAADWRWLLDRNDSPWYPTVRLFRQPEAGNWPAVIDQVRGELRSVFDNRLTPTVSLRQSGAPPNPIGA